MSRYSFLGNKAGSFARDVRGAAAVEFAAVLLPFLTLVFVTCDLAVATLAQFNLDFATSDAQRLIRTGQAQARNMSASEMRSLICEDMKEIMPVSCNDIFISVDTFESFSDVDDLDPVENGDVDPGQMNFSLGGPEEVVMVRTFYKHKLVTPGLSSALANLPDGYKLVASGFVFRNEPFPGGG